ncbi:MAG: LLM class flavin-dependent oxidoreductase [Clostridium perfringens]|uniref:LLM class flavin-dependent oxidoreductase n=1 Tax=Clostridium perfringens TaxID=1502 RepID=UPI000DF1078F|nr:LLM class flavin-dependent oxidoreductase [Clostridium perfringens]EGT0683768.1 LLM class flavin-dependent oxidoreductase [Clostridium perfringens]EGT0686798.1 LLM class flavin-dependent oxidoreductase [Clostridium perfringens]EIF2806969.1 LLM class flavin-dependent oxidoreductase [Clostridium perfringens]ELC8309347.1 LLM class flavin-dependent oxidoreductase [Clostridium perfringens]ELC8392264.1 LLM class flavin-dependent oxidoreductase [Clostridium perfringens]
MGIREDIKAYIISSGFTITKLAEELNKRNGSDYTVQNLSNKIRKEALKYSEVLQIADIIGYKIEWVKK